MLIGVVAAGYADGYPRHANDGTPVYINSTKSRIVGRVSMDMLTIDLTNIPNPQIGDKVELFGNNKSTRYAAFFNCSYTRFGYNSLIY